MTNNDILRRIRYTFDYSDTKMIGVFRLADLAVTRVQLTHWLKKDEDPEYVRLPDLEMATFLNGLIVEKRGKQDGPTPVPERRVTNNIIFRKLKIALNLTAEDILDIMELANYQVSKHELSAFFRKEGHKNFRECQDQILRNFLTGLQHRERQSEPKANKAPADKAAVKKAPAKTEPAAKKPVAEKVVDKKAPAKKAPAAKPSNSGGEKFQWGKAPVKGGKKSY